MELSLAHSVGSAVERAYARSDLFEKRRALMEKWVACATGAEANPSKNVILMQQIPKNNLLSPYIVSGNSCASAHADDVEATH